MIKVILFGEKKFKQKLSIITIDNYGSEKEIFHIAGRSLNEMLSELERKKIEIIELDLNYSKLKEENGKRFSQTKKISIPCDEMNSFSIKKIIKKMKNFKLN